jgi:hypothetical protein
LFILLLDYSLISVQLFLFVLVLLVPDHHEWLLLEILHLSLCLSLVFLSLDKLLSLGVLVSVEHVVSIPFGFALSVGVEHGRVHETVWVRFHHIIINLWVA